jgi:hypothetical protein
MDSSFLCKNPYISSIHEMLYIFSSRRTYMHSRLASLAACAREHCFYFSSDRNTNKKVVFTPVTHDDRAPGL